MLSVIMLSVIMLSVIMLSDIMLSITMLCALAPGQSSAYSRPDLMRELLAQKVLDMPWSSQWLADLKKHFYAKRAASKPVLDYICFSECYLGPML